MYVGVVAAVLKARDLQDLHTHSLTHSHWAGPMLNNKWPQKAREKAWQKETAHTYEKLRRHARAWRGIKISEAADSSLELGLWATVYP